MTIADAWAVQRLADKVSADLRLPEENLRIRKRARDFADAVLRSASHAVHTTPETRDGFRHDIFHAIADAGLYQIPYDTDAGGLGLEFPVLVTLTFMEDPK